MSVEGKPIPVIIESESDTTYTTCNCVDVIENEKLTEKEIPPHVEHVLSTVSRTEHYLRERRIPELIRFLMTKLIVDAPEREREFLEKILDDCMLFRAGQGPGPFLYGMKHLKAVVKSFDPGNRGWLGAGQVRRAYITLGLTAPESIDERIHTDEVLNMLAASQEAELSDLVSAGHSEYV